MSSARGPRRSCGDGRPCRGCPEGARGEHGCWKKLGLFVGARPRRAISTLAQPYGDRKRRLALPNVSWWSQRRRMSKVVERQKRASGRVALALMTLFRNLWLGGFTGGLGQQFARPVLLLNRCHFAPAAGPNREPCPQWRAVCSHLDAVDARKQ